MRLYRRLISGLILFLSVAVVFLQSQDLVTLAKKEKARRAKLTEKKSVVVTNADLNRLRVRSGVKSRVTSSRESSGPETPEIPGQEGAEGPSGDVDQSQALPEISLEERWRRADTKTRYLDMSLTRLGQRYYSAQNAEERKQIQQQISRTERELEAARVEAAELKALLEDEKKK